MGPEGWAIRLTRMLDLVYPSGIGRYPVDAAALAVEYSRSAFPGTPVKRVVADALGGFEGALVPAESGRSWGILYDVGQRPERARFTVAHEFGHYLLHRHLNPEGFYCGEEAVSRRSGTGVEKEADTFAAYLLMPFHDFRRMISPDHKPTLDELGEIAARYGVSLTAAALRWLEYTHRRALFVVSRDGFILWAKASDPAFRSGRFIRTRNMVTELPPLARCATGPIDADARAGIHHSTGVWFDEPVEEMTIASESLDLVMTLLHFHGLKRNYREEVVIPATLDVTAPEPCSDQ